MYFREPYRPRRRDQSSRYQWHGTSSAGPRFAGPDLHPITHVPLSVNPSSETEH